MMRRALRLATAATLVAGLVGVYRQRSEAQQVRRGRLVPASSSVHLPPVRPPGAIAGRLAAWVPPPPRSGPATWAARVWASPLTLVGLLLALVSRTRPVWSAQHRCWIAEGVGGASGLALRVVGADANAVGHVVLCRLPSAPPRLLAHELVHVRQAERFGPLLFPLYLWLGARYGYRDHPLERAARLGAQRAGEADADQVSSARP
jgi:hypothetical protein